jgi:hypothetical protein
MRSDGLAPAAGAVLLPAECKASLVGLVKGCEGM